jgi:hypothetical protein
VRFNGSLTPAIGQNTVMTLMTGGTPQGLAEPSAVDLNPAQLRRKPTILTESNSNASESPEARIPIVTGRDCYLLLKEADRKAEYIWQTGNLAGLYDLAAMLDSGQQRTKLVAIYKNDGYKNTAPSASEAFNIRQVACRALAEEYGITQQTYWQVLDQTYNFEFKDIHN